MVVLIGCGERAYTPRDGDILFQKLNTDQALDFGRASRSTFNNMGIVFHQSGRPSVLEVGDSVRVISLEAWTFKGEQGKFVAKRLRTAESSLTKKVINRIFRGVKRRIGTPQDLSFGWSDDAFYCSELVWKVFAYGAGIKLSKLGKLRDFDLSDPRMEDSLRQRHGGRLPLDEPAISPDSIFSSPLLLSVYEE
jgi:hypothetical protein